MPTDPIQTYNPGKLEPFISDDEGNIRNYIPPANSVLTAGTLMSSAADGAIILYNGAEITTPTTAPTIGDAGAGSLGAGTYKVAYSYVDKNTPAGETKVSSYATVTIAASHDISVTGLGTLPAGVQAVNWWMSRSAADDTDIGFLVQNDGTAFTISALPAIGAADPPTENTSHLKSDGSQNWSGLLLQYDIAVDAQGKVTFGSQTGGGPFGETSLYAPCYLTGFFRTEDLTGLDQHAIDSANARLISGSIAGPGVLRVG